MKEFVNLTKAIKWFLYLNIGIYGSYLIQIASNQLGFIQYCIVLALLLLIVGARHGIYEAAAGDKFWLTELRLAFASNLLALSWFFIAGTKNTAYFTIPLYLANLGLLVSNFHYHPNKKVKLAFRKKMVSEVAALGLLILLVYPILASITR